MRKSWALASVTVAAGALACASAASAVDYLYYSWAGSGGPAHGIGRVAQDGSTPADESFVPISGAQSPTGVAVTATNIYYTQGNVIFRAPITGGAGTSISPTLCQGVAGASYGISTLATDGSWLYYACNFGTANTGGYIGRASLDGSTLNNTFQAFTGAAFSRMMISDGFAYATGTTTAARVGRIAIAPGAAFQDGVAGMATATIRGVTTAGSRVYWGRSDGSTFSRIDSSALDFSGAISPFWTSGDPTLNINAVAAGRSYMFFVHTSNRIGRIALDGSGSADLAFSTSPGRQFVNGLTTAVTEGGSIPSPSPTPTPNPTPVPTPGDVASALATPAVRTTTGTNAEVTVRVQLAQKGRYTFIFQRRAANEMALGEHASSSKRVPMQKGTVIGKRVLKKAYTAAVITTTADNAKLVTKALLRKAQAKNLDLRVVYTATGGAQSESVIAIP